MDGARLLQELNRRGWVVAAGTAGDLRRALAGAGAQPTATQRGRSHSVLRPYTEQEAPPNTMSAVYGLEEQPLHTDGAHLQSPPDVIALCANEPSATPTIVWAGSSAYPTVPDSARSGIFTVRTKQGSFLTSAVTGRRIRYDPVCMSPSDGLAREAVGYFTSLRADAEEHHWDSPNLVLLIDNRRCLHARLAVAGGDETRRLERLTFRLEEN